VKTVLTALLTLALVPALAGEEFFDDFDGDRLGDHWSFGNPKGGMIYSVHDSLLEVYGFTGFFANREWITARLPRYDDFDMEARVGWTDEPMRQGFDVALGGGYPNDIAVAVMGFGRTTEGGRTINKVGASFRDGPSVEIEAPSSGFHTFRLTRSAGVFSAYLDQELILQGTGSGMPPDTIVLQFTAAGGRGEPVDMLVDRVSVVPEPASVLALVAGIGSLLLRSWRRTR
jgi:hypothetical protein